MQIRLIVPNCNRNTSPIVAYGKRLAEIAGGFTAFQAVGGWIDNQGQLIQEPVTVFDASLSDEYVSVNASSGQASVGPVARFRDLAKHVRRELNQECVYLSFDGQVELI